LNRPAVYYGLVGEELDKTGTVDFNKFPPSSAITLELCAGIVDKNIPNNEIAREELIEECGYNVPIERIEEVMKYRSGVGTSGSLQILYYCEVTDDDKIPSAGGGVDDEIIDVVEMSIDEARELMKQGSEHTSPPAFLFGILWFLANKAPKFSK
jgi:nudix-type nucleoside diphosphatase (YffH/AdpP family)